MSFFFPRGHTLKALAVFALGTSLTATAVSEEDPFIWLEAIDSERAMAWVEAQNKKSLARLEGDPRFDALRDRALKDYNASDKIAYSRLLGGTVDNLWRDEDHVRGLWRRTTVEEYAKPNPKWETILDFDELAEKEGENWVYKGRDCLPPAFSRCLLRLSRGGGDAVVVREFDAQTRTFPKDGFDSPEAKQWVSWSDSDSLLIATDFGADTMNSSGYPEQVRLWRRGTPLAEATPLIDGADTTVFNVPSTSHRPEETYLAIQQGPDFFTEIVHLLDVSGPEPALKQVNLPLSIIFQGFYDGRMLVQLRKDWVVGEKTYGAGSLVAFDIADALAGDPTQSLETVFAPQGRVAIEDVSIGRDAILITTLDEVKGALMAFTRDELGWTGTQLDLPVSGTVSVIDADEWSDKVFVNYESFLQPDTLYQISTSGGSAQVQSLPARFDATGLVTEQRFAASKDGTRVPYFVVRPENLEMDGTTPTMLYGYGGFEISITPSYLTGFGKLWVEQGGVYVLANIRGGGEFGPAWHQSALKENRQRAYDDFIAVAEDLVDSGLTAPEHLGVRGGSNGGLLTGVMLTQRPDLFNAVISAVPLLDMLRYHKLLAGASWIGEYGDPDIKEQREYISEYSPYQNLKKGVDYPEAFIYTSTRDDRVHPGHARKMTAAIEALDQPVLYYENIEGGHSAAANLKQRAYTDALQVVYALQQLSDRADEEGGQAGY